MEKWAYEKKSIVFGKKRKISESTNERKLRKVEEKVKKAFSATPSVVECNLLTPLCDYIFKLRQSKEFFVVNGKGYVLKDINSQDYAIIKCNGGELMCQCQEENCLHVKAVNVLFKNEGLKLVPGNTVQILSNQHFLAAVCDDSEINLVKKNRNLQLVCLTCKYGRHTCCHIKSCTKWIEDQGIFEEQSRKTEPYCQPQCFSTQPIPYPLPDSLKELFTAYGKGDCHFPSRLIPEIPEDNCPGGCPWSLEDPVEKGWYIGSGTIYKTGCSVTESWYHGLKEPISVYYRECSGPCKCKKMYDGQEDLLLNLDNRNFIFYELLFNYLYHMIEGRNPLAASHRAYQKLNETLSVDRTVPQHIFRKAWNSFCRLLNIDYVLNFQCQKCGPTPDIVICDGTSVGMRKDLLPNQEEPPESLILTGTNKCQRTLIENVKCRALLRKYCRKTLEDQEFEDMLIMMDSGQQTRSLSSLIRKIDIDKKCPANYIFLENLAKPSSVCALFQSTCLPITCINVMKFCRGLTHFMPKDVPLIHQFITDTPEEDRDLVKMLILDLAIIAKNTYKITKDNSYPPAPQDGDPLSFFPNLPRIHGDAVYAKDDKKASDNCRKRSRGHPSLSAGIFTVYCAHGICYGFEAMRKNESPQVPFRILKSRFATAPKVIVYDNACHLHEYCLNREPVFFRDCIFCVDRFHWVNHTGCSKGYCIDSYKGILDLNTLNTQANEQANAGLSRLKGHVSYMNCHNFMATCSLFLAFKNMDKQKQIKMPNKMGG